MASQHGPVKQAVEQALRQAFAPTALKVEDESAAHAGHAAMKGLDVKETHFYVAITSEMFAGKSRVQQHQLVYAALSEWMSNPIHALRLDVSAG